MSRTAFTLVELLVTVAIIATLAALLLPSLSTARSMALATACASNLRQAGIGALGFAADNDDGIVPANGWGWWDQSRYWNRTLAPYLDEGQNRQSRSTKRKGVLWGCPLWTESFAKQSGSNIGFFGAYEAFACGYGMQMAWKERPGSNQWTENSWTFIDSAGNNTPYDVTSVARWQARATNPHPILARFSQVNYVSRQPWISDYIFHDVHPQWHNYASNMRANHMQRHRGRMNTLFLDGHLERITHTTWSRRSNAPWLD